MRKTYTPLFFTFSFSLLTSLCIAQNGVPQGMPAGMPSQAGMFNPLVITNGQAAIDGKNSSSAIYNYSGADTVWSPSFTNLTDKESIVILYTKTTASNVVITFPANITLKKPTAMPGVATSGQTFTLSSVANGAFNILIQPIGSVYTVQITRTSMQ